MRKKGRVKGRGMVITGTESEISLNIVSA